MEEKMSTVDLDCFEFDPQFDLNLDNLEQFLAQEAKDTDDGVIRINPIASKTAVSKDLLERAENSISSRQWSDLEEFLKSPEGRDLFESTSTPPRSKPPESSSMSGRKTKREEMFGSSASFFSDDNIDGIKALRGGSLGRVIASTVAAGNLTEGGPVMPSTIDRSALDEQRRQIMKDFFSKINRCDIHGLVKTIRNCSEVCVLSTPDVLEPIIGRQNIMMLLSLFVETFPDGIWTASPISATSIDSISCTYRFMGTRVFDHSLNVLYRQIQSNMGVILAASNTHRLQHSDGTSEDIIDSQQLLNEVAESAVPTDTHHQRTFSGELPRPPSVKFGPTTVSHAAGVAFTSTSSSPRASDAGADDNEPIMVRRSSGTMREVKAIESMVLQAGPTSYRRKLEFLFNADSCEIIQIVFTNLL